MHLHNQAAPIPQLQNPEERLVTFHDIAASPDPRAVLEAVARTPEQIDAFLTESENAVADAGVELELGLRTDEEVERFNTAFDEHSTLLSVIGQSRFESDLSAGVPETIAKLNLVNLITDSQAAILARDIDGRLEGSAVERTKERIARGKISRWAGRVMITGLGIAAAVASTKGVEIGIGETAAEHTEAVLAGLGVVASARMFKNGYGYIAEKLNDKVDEYRPLATPKNQAESAKTPETPKAMRLSEVKAHMVHTEERLFAITGRHYVSTPDSAADLLTKMLASYDESFTEYYELEDSKRHGSTPVALLAGAVLSAPLPIEDVSEEIQSIAFAAREAMPKRRHREAQPTT